MMSFPQCFALVGQLFPSPIKSDLGMREKKTG